MSEAWRTLYTHRQSVMNFSGTLRARGILLGPTTLTKLIPKLVVTIIYPLSDSQRFQYVRKTKQTFPTEPLTSLKKKSEYSVGNHCNSHFTINESAND